MRFQSLGDKAGFISEHVRNAEASATIPKGTPVALVLNATEDGFAVVLPSTAGATKTHLGKYGVALDDILAGQIGEVQLAGVCRYAIMSLQTRANTSGGSTFGTADTVPLLAVLSVNSVNNFFSTKAKAA